MSLPADAIDRAAQIFVDAIAERDALSPRDAAIAAGARTEPEITRLAERIAADRQPLARPA